MEDDKKFTRPGFEIELSFKDIKLQGYYADKAFIAPLELPKGEYEALANLWRSALNEVRVRHPDPTVSVGVHVSARFNGVQIRIIMDGVADTTNQTKRMYGFQHYGFPTGWPGRTLAQQYLVALWSLYLVHEGQELTTHRNTVHWPSLKGEMPVLDPHQLGSVNQRILRNTNNMAEMLDVVLGRGRGQEMLDRNAAAAKAELEAEVRNVREQQAARAKLADEWAKAR